MSSCVVGAAIAKTQLQFKFCGGGLSLDDDLLRLQAVVSVRFCLGSEGGAICPLMNYVIRMNSCDTKGATVKNCPTAVQ